MFLNIAHDSALLPTSKASTIHGCIMPVVILTARQLNSEHARKGGQVDCSPCLPIFDRTLQLGCGFPNDDVLEMYSRGIVGFSAIPENGWIQI
jgi:hypothetical protein